MECGLLTAATNSRPGWSASSFSVSVRGSSRASMPPRPTSGATAPARPVTTDTASSRVRAPALYAAAISPRLCPITASGRTPSARQAAARDALTANSTGCRNSVRSNGANSSGARSTSSTDQPTCRRTASSIRASSSRKASDSAASSRPMPGHWPPCPAKTKATLPVGSARIGASGRCPAANASSRERSSSRSPATIAARCSKWLRCRARVWATSDRATSSSRWRARRAACPRTAASPRPDSANSRAPGAISFRVGVSARSASSRIRCALVPLIPKALTPARRTRSPDDGQATVSRSRCNPLSSQSTWRLGVLACRVRGRDRCRRDCTTLIRPSTPEAACA